jgi:regulator of sigma E protease
MQLILFVAILSVLVLIHELGHFVTAKFFRVRVEEFGIGLPPRAVMLFHKFGTWFSLNWLPLGGFVKLYGEDMDDESQVKSPEAFFNKPIWQRAIILSAGVIMNFVLAMFLFAVVYSVLGVPEKIEGVKILEVRDNSPAIEAGIPAEAKVNKIRVSETEYMIGGADDFIALVDEFKGSQIEIGVETGKETTWYEVTPRVDPPEGEGSLGVVLSEMEIVKYPWWQMPFRGVVVGFQESIMWGKQILNGLWTLISGLVTGQGVPSELAGPVGIYQVTKQVSQYGILAVLQFMGILSINLAILNIMPFPALDGGRLVFLVIEKVIGARRKNKFEGYVHAIGMWILLSLMALITIRDVWRLIIN